MTVTRTLIKLGGSALLAAGLAAGAQSAAYSAPAPVDAPAAAAPTITVTPSTDLDDGQAVQVDVTGFAPSETLYVGECTDINPDTSVCDKPGNPDTSFTTDEHGNGSTKFTVASRFDGYVVRGDHWGIVDCLTASCYLGVGNEQRGVGSGPLTFKQAGPTAP